MNGKLSNIFGVSASGAFLFKGDINAAADFPLLVDVLNGWTYTISTNVTDNDPTKTNTGQSFRVGDVIAWNGSLWTDITGIEVWIDDGTDVKTINDPRNVDLQNAGLKDNDVTVAIPLGDASNTVSNMTNQTLLGASNNIITKGLSTGKLTGGDITDAGGGNIDIAAGNGFFRSTDSHVGLLFELPWSQLLAQAIPSDTIRYIGVEYNAGSPQVIIKTTDVWNRHTEFPLGSVINESGTLHIVNDPLQVSNSISHIIERFYKTDPYKRADRVGGIILGETGTRNVTVTAGELYDRVNKYIISAIDTSGADTFDSYTGATLDTAATSQWDNDNYNNAGVKTSLSVNRYANLWFYVESDGDLVMVYGTAEYISSATAQNESPPSTIPARLQVHGKLIGRIIFQKGAGAATLIESAFTNDFTPSLATSHANLAGLANDDHTQYALLAGRTGGQTIIGGIAASDNLTFQTTSHGSKGSYIFSELNTVGGILRTDGSGIVTSSTSLPDGTTATTQTPADNSTKLATTAYADAIVGGVSWGETRTNGTGIGLTHTIGDSAVSGVQSFVTTIGNIQTNALTVNSINLGTSAIGHTGLSIIAQGASSSQKGISIAMGGAGTGIGLNISGSGAFTGIKVSGSNNSSTIGFEYFTSITNSRGTAFKVAAAISGRLQDFRVFDAQLSASTQSAGRVSDIFVLSNFINTSSSGSYTDDYDLMSLKRTMGSSGGTKTANGALLKLENVTTTAGLTDNVIPVEIVQDSQGLGIPISITQNAVISTNFRRVISEEVTGTQIWIGDGATSPDTNLSGQAGDICLNGDSGNIYRCTGTTNWTAM